MHNVRSYTHEHENDKESKSYEQFPVDTRVLRSVRFDTNSTDGDFARIVVMNDQVTSECAAYREYHYGNTSISIEHITSFTMRSSTMAGTQETINSFVGSMPLHIHIEQSASWHCGVYGPSGTRKRLYKATDPDDSTKMIGVLIEQDAQGKLTQITWYKTQDASALFRATPVMLDFDLVTDETGVPSLDPNDMGGWTWYYTTSLGRC